MTLRATIKKLPYINTLLSVSGGHKIISAAAAKQLRFDQQWKNDSLPKKQLSIVQKELTRIKQTGKFPDHMQALINQLQSLQLKNPSLLEIGCSSGYYSEVIQLAGLTVTYEGCDYSEAFIALARKLYPQHTFKICDNTQLNYVNSAYDIVISGCCILHILDYPQAIRETARVAKRFVIFSRTPIVHLNTTTYTRKKGYGVDMVEIFFNEQEFSDLLSKNGLVIRTITTIAADPTLSQLNEMVYIKTYLCEKILL